jgi:hypothetical protein
VHANLSVPIAKDTWEIQRTVDVFGGGKFLVSGGSVLGINPRNLH